MPTTMSVSQARAALTEVIDRVSAGEEVTLTRHGVPVAVLVRPDALRARRSDEALAAAERVRDLLERGRAASLSLETGVSEARAEELIADVRAARSRR